MAEGVHCDYCGADIIDAGVVFTTRDDGCYCWLNHPEFGRITFHKRGFIQLPGDAVSIQLNAREIARGKRRG